jgi:hypothetical protein
MYRLTARETRKLTAKEKIMPDNAPQHTPGPWTIYNHDGTNSGHYDGYLKSDIRAGADLIHIRQSVAGNTFPRLAANVRLIAAAPSMYDALNAVRRPVAAVYERFKHLDRVLEMVGDPDGTDSTDPFHAAARDLWRAVKASLGIPANSD